MSTKLGVGTLAVATLVASGSANASRQDFVLYNKSGRTIEEAHLSPAYSPYVGPDVLGARVLLDYHSTSIVFDAYTSTCVWDLTVIFDNGQRSVGRHNLCQVAAVTVE